MIDCPADIEYNQPPQIVHEQVVSADRYVASWNKPLRYIAAMHLSTMSKKELDQDWKLNDFFETVVVINLPQSKQRLKKITQQKQQIGNPVFHKFAAVDGEHVAAETWSKFQSNRENYDPNTEEGQLALQRFHKREAGCYLSHYGVIKWIKKSFDKAVADLTRAQVACDYNAIREAEQRVYKYSRVLILEDDAAFGIINKKRTTASRKGCGVIFRKALLHIPDEWGILYFVVHATKPSEQVAPNLRKLTKSWSAVAYAVNYTMYEPLLEKLSAINDPNKREIYPVDTQISEMQYLHNVYAIYPSIVYHQDGVSQISGRYRPMLWQGQAITKD